VILRGAHSEFPKLAEECVACSGASFTDFVESNNHQILRCCDCGLLLVSPRPSEGDIKKLFEDEYIGDENRVTFDFTAMRVESLRREVNRIKRLMPGGGRLLDVGTASGAFLACFCGDPNWKVEGLEPSKFGAKAAARMTGCVVHQGFLRDQGFAAEAFDVITSLDAFMFHPEPKMDLLEISRILRPGGLLAIEIPGLRFRLLKNKGFLCRLIYRVPVRLNAGVHLFYYTRRTLGMLVRQFGFEEVAVFPEQSPLYGSWYTKIGNWAYFGLTNVLYRISGGFLNVVPKEFIVYRKAEK